MDIGTAILAWLLGFFMGQVIEIFKSRGCENKEHFNYGFRIRKILNEIAGLEEELKEKKENIRGQKDE